MILFLIFIQSDIPYGLFEVLVRGFIVQMCLL
jgi:hypothetical protein